MKNGLLNMTEDILMPARLIDHHRNTKFFNISSEKQLVASQNKTRFTSKVSVKYNTYVIATYLISTIVCILQNFQGEKKFVVFADWLTTSKI